LMKLDIWASPPPPKISRENSSVIESPKRITGTLHHVFTFMTISRWIIRRMRNVSNKNCRENQNAHFIFSNFFPENRAVYEVISRNVVEPERPQTIWRRVACCVSKATRATTHASARSRTPPTTQMCNTAFATTAVVSWTHLRCYVIRTLPVLLFSVFVYRVRVSSVTSLGLLWRLAAWSDTPACFTKSAVRLLWTRLCEQFWA
jgi:hypothetical protein